MKKLLNQKTVRRLFRTVLTLLFVMTLLIPELAPAAHAVKQSDIDALKSKAQEISSQKKDLQSKIDALADDISNAMAKKQLLDQKISALSEQISNTEAQISGYASLISQTEAELADAQEKEAAQQQLFDQRVRAMEERGAISYWSVLFKASSFTDLLSRLDFINEIMDSDQGVIDELRQLQDEISAKKADLETSKQAAESAKADLTSQKSELDTQRSQANALVAQLENSKGAKEDAMDDLSDEEEAVQAQAVALSKKLAEEQAAAAAAAGQSAPQTNPGGYIWPVDSRYITSTVGGRASPGGVGSTNHKGTDIGRVGYTSSIYASKAGTVIISQYSSSYGNYVVISHGSGNTTLYAHMSSRKVDVGQYVNQGAVIGITGSTGHSTGPHLHFEVTENGVRVNPLSDGAAPRMGYLSGYTLGG
jgi:murein DD-endopeptidase MepM/ murein hydrolase activator NlpD